MEGFRKPVIGLTGGIGAGKSTVAAELARLGCAVIDSDRLAGEVLHDPAVLARLRKWWGDGVFRPDGTLDRAALAARTFSGRTSWRRMNRLIHPRVGQLRLDMMRRLAYDNGIQAVVWDSPLLVETGLHQQCDAVIFVQAAWKSRLQRVRRIRKWDADQLRQREEYQFPLDKKAQAAQYILINDGDLALIRDQVRDLLSKIKLKFRRRTAVNK